MRRIGISLIALFLVSVVSISATAQETFPPWTTRTCGGETYACYGFEEARTLRLFAENARHWQAELALQIDIVRELQMLNSNIHDQLILEQDAVALQKTRIDELITQLNKEIAEKNRWRADAEGFDLWPVVIGVGVGTLGLTVGVMLALAN